MGMISGILIVCGVVPVPDYVAWGRTLFVGIGVEGLECLYFPFGTVLGVFAIVVIARPDVKGILDRQSASRV
jgi:hypothetical protein